jgi:Protein of unknown function (DUF4235)
MNEPGTNTVGSQESATVLFGHPVNVAVSEMAVTWAVRRALNALYRRATGRPVPTARDPDIPFRRIVLWAAGAAAAVAAADVVVDRPVLRAPITEHSGAGQRELDI